MCVCVRKWNVAEGSLYKICVSIIRMYGAETVSLKKMEAAVKALEADGWSRIVKESNEKARGMAE